MYYAQIDENGICFAVTETAGQIDQADMIEIDGLDDSLLLKRWTGEAWEVVPIEPVEPVDPPPVGPDRLTPLEEVVDAILTGGETV